MNSEFKIYMEDGQLSYTVKGNFELLVEMLGEAMVSSDEVAEVVIIAMDLYKQFNDMKKQPN